jgi:hypothetical protein
MKFANSVQSAQSGIDAAMSINYDWTRNGFIEEFSTKKDPKFSEIIIQPKKGYAWTIKNPPIYLDVKRTRSALADLNSSFSKYSILLLNLADGSLVNTETFDQMTKDLNKNASDALKALNVEVPNQGLAIFSTIAIESARLFIEKKRQKYLLEAIKKNQTNVEGYSNLCISLIHTIRGTVKSYYTTRREAIKKQWLANKGKKRIENTEHLLTLNEQFIDTMRTLQELEETYAALPVANADLAKAIEDPEFNMKGIQQLYSSAHRLQKLYKELTK